MATIWASHKTTSHFIILTSVFLRSILTAMISCFVAAVLKSSTLFAKVTQPLQIRLNLNFTTLLYLPGPHHKSIGTVRSNFIWCIFCGSMDEHAEQRHREGCIGLIVGDF